MKMLSDGGSTPPASTKLNESRFSNHFIEKRDLSYSESLAMQGFSSSRIWMLVFQSTLNAKLIF